MAGEMKEVTLKRTKFNRLVGKRIREIRKEKGISVKAFESRDGSIDRSDLSKIETGKLTASSYTLYKISRVLNVDIRYFFDELR